MGFRERLKENIHHWTRFQVIVRIFVRHGFSGLIQELGWLSAIGGSEESSEGSQAARLRKAFEELGPSFIKLGQILSTRSDLLPAEYIEEFSKLTDRITPLPFHEIREVVEREFGRPIAELFESIEEIPLAAASIAQVHRAVLKDENAPFRNVVIKVQRPGITETIQSDIQILYVVAQALEKLRDDFKLFNLQAVVQEFQRSIFEELDFVLEAKNIDTFQKIVEDHPQISIPKVFWPLTTKQVLTMTELKGTTLSQVYSFPPHIDRKKLAESTVKFFVDSMFFHGIFHCDAHTGNLLINFEGAGEVGVVDFGMVGKLNEGLRDRLTRLFLSLVTQDFQSMAITYSELTEFGRRLSVREFQADLEHLLAPNLAKSLSQVDVGKMMQESLSIAQKHKIRMPRDLILFFRAVVTVEHIGRNLDPDFRFSEFGQKFSREIIKRQLSTQNLSRDLLKGLEGLRSLPGAIRSLAHKLESDSLFPQFEGLEKGLESFKRSNQLLALSIIFMATLVGTSLLTALVPAHVMIWPLWGAATLLFAILVVKSLRS